MRVVDDCELRMIVQHPLQQSRAGPGTSDYKQKRVPRRPLFLPASVLDHAFFTRFSIRSRAPPVCRIRRCLGIQGTCMPRIIVVSALVRCFADFVEILAKTPSYSRFRTKPLLRSPIGAMSQLLAI